MGTETERHRVNDDKLDPLLDHKVPEAVNRCEEFGGVEATEEKHPREEVVRCHQPVSPHGQQLRRAAWRRYSL